MARGRYSSNVSSFLFFFLLSFNTIFPFFSWRKIRGSKLGEIYSFILDEYLLNDYAVLGARTIAGKVMIPNLVELQSKSRPWNQTELGFQPGNATSCQVPSLFCTCVLICKMGARQHFFIRWLCMKENRCKVSGTCMSQGSEEKQNL